MDMILKGLDISYLTTNWVSTGHVVAAEL